MVRAPGHPRAGRSPYVFEHILIAEDLLCRYLVEGETVHHINGVRDDNRPENLELWTRPQPSGIRVSDAIAWARTIYDRYVDERTLAIVNRPLGVHADQGAESKWEWQENPRNDVAASSIESAPDL
jgi:hypothetical protein